MATNKESEASTLKRELEQVKGDRDKWKAAALAALATLKQVANKKRSGK